MDYKKGGTVMEMEPREMEILDEGQESTDEVRSCCAATNARA